MGAFRQPQTCQSWLPLYHSSGLSRVFSNRLLAPETSERFWKSFCDWRSKDCRMQTGMTLSTKWIWKLNLFLLSVLLFTPLNTFPFLFPRSPPPFFYSPSFALSFLVPDYKGLPASNAWAAAWPCCLHKFHPVSVSHPRGHRLLHLQGLINGLHGESDAGPAGLSRRCLHHGASFPHQHRDVPGHESQVC